MKTLIQNAQILDGTGSKAFYSDILISEGKISEIGIGLRAEGAAIINGEGLTACPGFIDIHTHNELQLISDPQHLCAISQGITTEVVAQCGLGTAPTRKELLADIINLYAGILGQYNPLLHTWESFEQYLFALNGAAVNTASPVAHSALRILVMGYSSEQATKSQRVQMASQMEKAMEQGAVGFSTGLSYYPAGYSDTQELIDICKAVKKYDGLFLVHKRDNFCVPRDLGDAEIVRVIEETGVRTHMLHYKTSPDTAGRPDTILKPYQDLLNRGADITFELYPYPVGAGFGIVFLPPWVMEGGFNKVIHRLSDSSLREKILEDMAGRFELLMSKENIRFCSMKHTKEYEGKTLEQTSHVRNQPNQQEALLDLLLENELEIGYFANPVEDETITKLLENDYIDLINLPFYGMGSDSICYGKTVHPRVFGSFTKMLRLAKEHKYPIEKMINKLTMFPAERFRLSGKGRLAVGMDADICLFNFDKVSDQADFNNTTLISTGIDSVFVNGIPALLNGKPTGDLNGRSIKPCLPIRSERNRDEHI